MPQCNLKEDVQIGDRIKRSVERHRFYDGRFGKTNRGKITISAGLAVYQSQFDKLDLLQRADEALYKAKQLGRNRLEVALERGHIKSIIKVLIYFNVLF